MELVSQGNYEIDHIETVAEGTDLRVRVFTMGAGQFVPWHYHTEITDSFVCLTGRLVVETRAPRHTYRLGPGERCQVPPKTAHYVHGAEDADGRISPASFLIVQGVGDYDFVPVGQARTDLQGEDPGDSLG